MAAMVPLSIPGAMTSLLSSPSGCARGGTSFATMAEVNARPPSPAYSPTGTTLAAGAPSALMLIRRSLSMIRPPFIMGLPGKLRVLWLRMQTGANRQAGKGACMLPEANARLVDRNRRNIGIVTAANYSMETIRSCQLCEKRHKGGRGTIIISANPPLWPLHFFCASRTSRMAVPRSLRLMGFMIKLRIPISRAFFSVMISL